MNRKLTAVLGGLAAAALAAGGSVALAATGPTGSTGSVAPHAGPVLTVSSARASTDDGNVAANTLDGDLGTRWSGEGDGAWIDFDLGSSQTVGSVGLAWYQGDTRTFTFDLQISANDSSWTTVVSGKKTSGATAGFETYDFADASARYVRVVGHGNTKNDWTSISEAHVQGADGGGDPGDPGDCTKPSDILDLDNWYLGLPIGDDEDPTNIEQPELNGYRIDPWFTTTSDCTGVQFRAAVNGVTTSGSSYPRSELRETDGSENASWSSTSGTSTMVVKEKITHLPNDKDEVVAGQIHGSDDDLTVFRLEGSSLYVTNDDDAHYKLVTSSYQLGTVFEAKFVVSGGVTKAYYNGSLVATIDKDYSGAYFKAGAYTQANCDKSDPCSASNYGEVVIQSLSVTHN